MESYTKVIITKEELVNIIVWPRIENSSDLESDLTKRTIKATMNFSKVKLAKAIKKTNLNIVSFGDKYVIRYAIK